MNCLNHSLNKPHSCQLTKMSSPKISSHALLRLGPVHCVVLTTLVPVQICSGLAQRRSTNRPCRDGLRGYLKWAFLRHGSPSLPSSILYIENARARLTLNSIGVIGMYTNAWEPNCFNYLLRPSLSLFFKIFFSILTDLFSHVNFKDLTFLWRNN